MDQYEKDQAVFHDDWPGITPEKFRQLMRFELITENVKDDPASKRGMVLMKNFIQAKYGEVDPCDCVPKEGQTIKCVDNDCLNVRTGVECDETCDGPNALCRNRQLSRGDSKKLKLVQNGDYGFAVEAGEDILSHELISEYMGVIYASIDNPHHDTTVYAADVIPSSNRSKAVVIEPTDKGNISRYFQHSHDPNCQVRVIRVGDELRLGVFAKRFIRHGTQVTWDYGTDFREMNIQTCACGDLSLCPDAIRLYASRPLPSSYPRQADCYPFPHPPATTAGMSKKRKMKKVKRKLGQQLALRPESPQITTPEVIIRIERERELPILDAPTTVASSSAPPRLGLCRPLPALTPMSPQSQLSSPPKRRPPPALLPLTPITTPQAPASLGSTEDFEAVADECTSPLPSQSQKNGSKKKQQFFPDAPTAAPQRMATGRRFGLPRPTCTSQKDTTHKKRELRISDGTPTGETKKLKEKSASPFPHQTPTVVPEEQPEETECGPRGRNTKKINPEIRLRRSSRVAATQTPPCTPPAGRPGPTPKAPKKAAAAPRLPVPAAAPPTAVAGPSNRVQPAVCVEDEVSALRKKVDELLKQADDLAKRRMESAPSRRRPVGRPQNMMWKCGDCGKEFKLRHYFKRHLEAHLNVRDIPCGFPGCTKSFNNQNSRDTHYQTHFDRDSRVLFECRSCGKKYTRGADCTVHMDNGNCPYRRYKRVEPSGKWRYGTNKAPGSESSSDENKQRPANRQPATYKPRSPRQRPGTCIPKEPIPGPGQDKRRGRAKPLPPSSSEESAESDS